MRFPLRIVSLVFGCSLLTAVSIPAFSQGSAPAKPAAGTPVPPSEVYGKLLGLIEKEFVSAVEAMPEDKFDFAPPTTSGEFKGVRTFAEQVKHVTEANGFFFHDPAKPMADTRSQIEKLKTKAEILQALKDSLAQAHSYIDSMTPENAFVTTGGTNVEGVLPNTRAGMASLGIAHMLDHYGQMAEYLRMNGIIPPASRGGM